MFLYNGSSELINLVVIDIVDIANLVEDVHVPQRMTSGTQGSIAFLIIGNSLTTDHLNDVRWAWTIVHSRVCFANHREVLVSM